MCLAGSCINLGNGISFTNVASPEGYFDVRFVQRTASRYSSNFIFRHGLTQEDILCYHLPDDLDAMMHYRDTVAETLAGQFRVFDQNPIHLGLFLVNSNQKVPFLFPAICEFVTTQNVYACMVMMSLHIV